MRRCIVTLVAVLAIAGSAAAQTGEKAAEKVASPNDTLLINVSPAGGTNQFQLDISLVNANALAGMVVPLEVKATGGATMKYDSVTYAGGRVEYFQLKSDHVPEDNKSTLLLGLIADLSGTKPPLPAGSGMVATVFYTADKPMTADQVKIRAVRIPPANELDYTTPELQSVTPTFVVKAGKAPKKAEPAKEKPAAGDGK